MELTVLTIHYFVAYQFMGIRINTLQLCLCCNKTSFSDEYANCVKPSILVGDICNLNEIIYTACKLCKASNQYKTLHTGVVVFFVVFFIIIIFINLLLYYYN